MMTFFFKLSIRSSCHDGSVLHVHLPELRKGHWQFTLSLKFERLSCSLVLKFHIEAVRHKNNIMPACQKFAKQLSLRFLVYVYMHMAFSKLQKVWNATKTTNGNLLTEQRTRLKEWKPWWVFFFPFSSFFFSHCQECGLCLSSCGPTYNSQKVKCLNIKP